MSDAPNAKPQEPNDPLLAALQQLPTHTIDGSVEERLERRARARYVKTFDGSAWQESASSVLSRVVVPGLLAGIVGIYMTWAFNAASALLR